MPVPASLDDLSQIPAENSPAGSEAVFPNLDDYLRTYAAFIAQVDAKIQEARDTVYPVASLLFSQERTGVPDGFLELLGQVIARADYARLTDRIYVGDSLNATAAFNYRCTDQANPSDTRSTTGAYMVLADARGEFFRGFDAGRGVDPSRAWASLQGGAIQSHNHGGSVGSGGLHSHGVNDPSHSHELQTIGNDWSGAGGDRETPTGQGRPPERTHGSMTGISIQAGGEHVHPLTINSSGGAETRPRNIPVRVFIRY